MDLSSRVAQSPASNCPKSAMADRPGKMAKLQSLRSRLPYVSQSALSKILQLAAQEELPGSSSRKDVRRARDDSVKEWTPYGALHQTITLPASISKSVELEVQNPFAMFWYSCAKSKCFSDLVSRTLASNLPTVDAPWRLVLYADEILPGNQLAYKNARKMWGMYWSILTWGSAVLSDEDQIAMVGMIVATNKYTNVPHIARAAALLMDIRV